MSALDLLVRTIKSQKFGRPFYSKLDEALENLPRQKGTAEEFLRELEKQPGVKKAEIEDRGIRKALENRAKAPDAKKPITKERMQKILYDQAPMPPVVEDVLGGKSAQYAKYRTPGGEKYREILLKLPEDYLNDPYISDHYGDTPNILAHIRVQDFQSPTKGYAVVNTRSGNKSPVFQTMEEAQAYMAQMPESLQGMLKIDEAAGKPKKVLLVDEVQSDWHQTGRKEGYSSPYAKRNLEVDQRLYEYAQEDKAKAKAAMEAAEAAGDNPAYEASRDKYLDLVQRSMTLDSQIAKQKQAIERGVPDAPFKKNWHELAMKRVLDYAAENGYDTVAITPGIQQVKRYEDATRQAVDEVAMYGDTLVGFKDGRRVIEQPISSPDELEKYVGKDIAQKLSTAAPDMNFIRSVKGEDLTVGGEGMRGFYDKILPDYLNNYGKQYGAQVGELDLITKPEVSTPQIAAPGIGHFPEPLVEPAQIMKAHSIDITPQMREQIKTKGQPLYSKIGVPGAEATAGAGTATIGSQMFDENNEQSVQNPVHFTENPDAMLLELMQRN